MSLYSARIAALIGQPVRINASRDVAMYEDLWPLINAGPIVTLVRVRKDGLCEVRDADGKLYTVPQRNVEAGET